MQFIVENEYSEVVQYKQIIDILIRVNFDRENIARMKKYLDFLKAEFAENEQEQL